MSSNPSVTFDHQTYRNGSIGFDYICNQMYHSMTNHHNRHGFAIENISDAIFELMKDVKPKNEYDLFTIEYNGDSFSVKQSPACYNAELGVM